MTVIQLDGRAMRSRSDAHDHLQQKLAFPEYYGRNLDALHDLLTERSEPVTLELLYPEEMLSDLGPYAEALLHVLRDAAENNPNLDFRICE